MHNVLEIFKYCSQYTDYKQNTINLQSCHHRTALTAVHVNQMFGKQLDVLMSCPTQGKWAHALYTNSTSALLAHIASINTRLLVHSCAQENTA